jgi:formylglycine-generating enzyme required for sulfatase activity
MIAFLRGWVCMTGKIFINYRRGDDPGFTQALYQRLEDEFAAGDLFMDVEGHIKPGDDFVDVLNAQVAAADVLLTIIGPRWTELLAARAGDPDDFVTIEIKAALEQGKRVIPVLVGGADMPRVDALPQPIRQLARRNAVGLRPERFRADCQGLVTALKEHLAAAEKERVARTEAERQAAEAGRLEVEAQAAARARAAEERGRAQAAAGLSPDEIRKAEELASWDFVKERNDVQDLRDHLARFPGGTTERYALSKLDGLVWAGLGSVPNVAQVRAYLDEFPKGANAGVAKARIGELERGAAEARAAEERRAQETADWGAVAASTEPNQIAAFLSKWPTGQHAQAAKARLAELKRTPGTLRRGMLLGAGLMGVVVLVAGGAWWNYEKIRWRLSLRDASLKVLDRSAQQSLKSRDTFKECATCPEMVVVPAGEFTMGSPANEKDRTSGEGPQHRVVIATPFAISKYEVTFTRWDACAEAGACNHYRPDDQGWGRGTRPVINVSWFDATAYAEWLSAKTGQRYRLLTESEWEYAARAGSRDRYWFGDDETQLGDYAWYAENSGGKTQPVGTKKANAFGLYDVHGNVFQWVEDCNHKSYQGAPSDGSAWIAQCGDGRRVVRGGSWLSHPDELRAASRIGYLTGSVERYKYIGFRVGRTLAP